MRLLVIVIVSILLIYVVTFFTKLKYVDKSAIMYSMKDVNAMDSLHILLFPFKETNYIARKTNGRIYLKYISKYPELMKKMKNKMFWIYTLQKYNIPHETLIANCEESHCFEHDVIDKDAEYVEYSNIEPKVVKGSDIILKEGVMKAWTENKCKSNSVFKIVTLYNQELFCVWDIETKKPMTKLLLHNKTDSQCFSNCDLKEDAHNKKLLFQLATKLSKMHFEEFSSLFSISWHVQLCDSDVIVVEANADPFTEDMSDNDELVNKYKQKLQEFFVLGH
tara:strand:+ start:8355 stop:9188 length:834 start_codon:yes stop_codon:yes gene_type:complete